MATKNHPKGSKLPNGYVTKGGGDDNDRSERMPAYMAANPRAFKVVVHKNSDSNNPGKKLTVGRNKHGTFEQFLDECTEKLKPAFGAARRLYTSRGTRRVFRVEDLCEDSIYVITGSESFKPLNYREISEQRFNKRPKFKKIDGDRIITPVVHAPIYKDRPGRSLAEGNKRKGLTFRVILNNNDIDSASPVNVRPQDKENMDSIINEIAKITKARVHRLFSIDNEGCHGPSDFKEICDCHEFCPNMHVLVVPEGEKPTYKRYPIGGRLGFKIHTSPRTGLHYNYPDFEPTALQFRHNLSLNRQKVLPSISSGSNKQSEAYSPFSNAGSHAGRRNKQRSRGTRQVDYDKDDAGVYRAKKQNNARGAQQVNETRDTRTERPIDQMEAEIVEEERVNEDAGMHQHDDYEDDSFNRYGYEPNSPRGQRKDDYDRRSPPRGQSKDDYDRRSPPRGQSKDDYDRRSPPRGQSKDMRSSTPASRGQSRQQREIKEHQAATKIQAGARGYLTRKKVAAGKQNKQASNRQREEEDDRRRREEEDRMREYQAQQSSQKKAMDEDAAASKIQASFKGYKTRKEISTKKQQGQK